MSEDIQWNDQGHPLSTQFDDIYFSTENGLDETRYVFLDSNHLNERFKRLSPNTTFTIAETGFGTGLNFLATCQLWQQYWPQDSSSQQAHLEFISVEKYPLEKSVIQRALQLWPELSEFTERLLDVYPQTITGFHRLSITDHITLTLIIDDACVGFQQLLSAPDHMPFSALTKRQWSGVDAWFLDGFAPAKNPDMWSDKLFQLMAALSQKKATVATFTAAGIVRRGLITAGFSVEKKSGYGSKREMLTGVFCSSDSTSTVTKSTIQQTSVKKQSQSYQYRVDSWANIHDYTPTPTSKTIAVIGGGIAGCHTAYSLAKKGYKVTIFEKGNQLAVGASGNTQGVLYTKLSTSQEPQGDFNLYSLLHAQQFYRRYWQAHQHQPSAGSACGVMQLSMGDKQQSAHQAIAQRFCNEHVNENHANDEQGINPNSIAYMLSKEEASQLANTSLNYPALFFPSAGWINPAQLCEWLIQHNNIEVIYNTSIETLAFSDAQWCLYSQEPQQHSQTQQYLFDNVVIANAIDALRFSQTQHLPIKTVRGQVTHYPATTQSMQLRTVICGKGYIAPAASATTNKSSPKNDKVSHCLGASFNLSDNSTELNPNDHLSNLTHAQAQTPDIIDHHILEKSHYQQLSGRVGFRCVTPDYLPIVGGAPIADETLKQFHALKHDAKKSIAYAGYYYPNLYINLGHGSRGLAYSPLCSEILANLISGSPPPIPQALLQRLNPSRFLIRDLIRS